MQIKTAMTLLAFLLTLISCNGGGGGGGSSSGSNNPQNNNNVNTIPSNVGVIQGLFLDSAVIGLSYSTPSQGSQVTNGSGQFNCQAGEVVTFSLGGFSIGQSQCLATVTPLSLVTNSRIDYPNILDFGSVDLNFSDLSASENLNLGRLLQFLQTVDNDGNPSNGIVVDSNAASAIQSFVSTQAEFDAIIDGQTQADFDQSMIDLAATMGGSTAAQSNITVATSHFRTTINNLSSCVPSDITGASDVAGSTLNCIALACISGFTLNNGSCVDNSVPQASEVVADTVDFFNANLATVNFITDLTGGPSCTLATSFAAMESLYNNRATNNFLTDPIYVEEIRCLDAIVNTIVVHATDSSPFGLDRDSDVLEVTGAASISSSIFSANTNLLAEELVILELLFALQ